MALMRSKLSILVLVITTVLAVQIAMPTVAMAATWYRVHGGDSIWRLAQRHGTTVDRVARGNGLSRWSPLYPGQVLLVPGRGEAIHWVGHGESLYSIARAYGVTVNRLRAMNGLYTTNLWLGQRLSVPVADTQSPSAHVSVAATRTRAGAEAWEVDLLARIVSAEAKGEPYTGQVAVASVILNRVRSSKFPNSIYGVVYQRSQFEPVQNGSINAPASASARRAAEAALNGWDPSYGALYFWNPSKASSSFLWSLPFRTRIGSHRFVG